MLAYNLDELAIARRTLSDSIDLVNQLWLGRNYDCTYSYWPHLGAALIDQLTRNSVQGHVPHDKARRLVLMILTS